MHDNQSNEHWSLENNSMPWSVYVTPNGTSFILVSN